MSPTPICEHTACTCESDPGSRFCSDHCAKETRDGALQGGPCHCGHDGCGGSDRGPVKKGKH